MLLFLGETERGQRGDRERERESVELHNMHALHACQQNMFLVPFSFPKCNGWSVHPPFRALRVQNNELLSCFISIKNLAVLIPRSFSTLFW